MELTRLCLELVSDQTEHPGKKDLGQGVDQKPQWLSWENQSLQNFTNLGFMGEWPDGSHS
jgi:hypothetical protein